jgi:2-polyprenyl-3-methyl-5-hydroxy-6-metoxy-1,4-benzoquinol methylase
VVRSVFLPELDIPEAKVLDLGAATGANASGLARAGFRVVAVEPDADLLDQVAASPIVMSVAYCRSDGCFLPFGSGTFDGAIAIEVLEHIERPELVLVELQRVLRCGGRVCIAVPTSYTERMYTRIHPRYASNSRHVNVFERSGLVAMLQAAGFEVDEIVTRNLAPALAWIGHSILHSDADHTGAVRQHRWIDLLAAGTIRLVRILPLLRVLLTRIESRFGKSIYVYAHKRPCKGAA